MACCADCASNAQPQLGRLGRYLGAAPDLRTPVLQQYTLPSRQGLVQLNLNAAGASQSGLALRAPLLRVFNLVLLGAGGLMLALGNKQAGATAIVLSGVDAVVRQLSVNYDAAVGALPYNGKVL